MAGGTTGLPVTTTPSGGFAYPTHSACSGRYAEAWEFATFWCVEQMLTGYHEGVGPGDVGLIDSTADFVTKGIQANKKFILWNTTQSVGGYVTAVTEHTLTATGVTWNLEDTYRIALLTGIERDTIEHYLDVAANDITAVVASVGGCDCTISNWGIAYLNKLNVIDAAAYYTCDCGGPRFTDSQRQNYLTWMGEQLTNISLGVIDVCQGATGANYPVIGWAEQSVTEFAAADIIVNDILRNSS